MALSTACSGARTPEAAGSRTSAPTGGATAPTAVRPPTANAVFDYQLGGAYPPPAGVRAVSRDRTARPAPGLYNICYVNAFQAQPDAAGVWKERHPELLLRDGRGEPVIDEDWNEPLLDISTGAKRRALMDIVGPWIDGCAKAGFDAVEPDNLDSYERSGGKLTSRHAAAFAQLLAHRAHRRHLAIAQKNTTGLLPQHRRIGFDFAVVEECARYQEFTDFAEAYAQRIFVIEYEKKDFTTACRAWGKALSISLRDREVRPAGAERHVAERC
ncbi:endo alpha-1,4 polygalactosaminidase [Streptomyces sp. NPDC048434]|uniref:endo alpha-1,4 polygalactosaminidase n=1 Tax=Streptomyces sp. NPDC048434 TaxID=3365549 RepID=UPI0037154AFE